MKNKTIILFSMIFALFLCFAFNKSGNAISSNLPVAMEENTRFSYDLNENVSYNGYKVTYYYFDKSNNVGYSHYEFKLLGEDYKGKTLTLQNMPISDLNNESYKDDNVNEAESCYYFEIVLFQRTYTYLGSKVDNVVKTIKSEKIPLKVVVNENPVLVSPSNGKVFKDFNVNFEVLSDFEYQIFISDDNSSWIRYSDLVKFNDNTTYYWKAVDTNGLESDVRSFSFDLDPVKPVLSITANVDGWNKENVSIDLKKANKGDSYYCTSNNNCVIFNEDKTVTLNEDGIYQLYAYVLYKGNKFSTDVTTVKIDKTAPVFNENSYNFEYYISSDPYKYNYRLSLKDITDISGVKDGKIEIYNGLTLIYTSSYVGKSISYDLSNELSENSSYNLKVYLSDNALNSASYDFVIKTPLNPVKPTPKPATITVSGKTEEFTNENVTVNVTLDNNYFQGSVDYYCVNNTCKIIRRNESITYSEDGRYIIFTKRVVDGETYQSERINILIDKTAPSLEGRVNFVETLKADYSYSYELNIVNFFDLSGVKSINISILSNNTTIYNVSKNSLPIKIDLSNVLSVDSTYTLNIEATDEALNKSVYTQSIKTSKEYVATPVVPTVEFVGTINSYTSSNVIAKVKVDEGTFDVALNYYCVNNSCYSITQKSVEITFDEDGVYNFYVKSSINNNEVSSSITKIMIDKTAPSLENKVRFVETLNSDKSYSYKLYIESVNDSSGVNVINVSIFQNVNSIYNVSKNILPIELDLSNILSVDSTYSLKIEAIDKALNSSVYTQSIKTSKAYVVNAVVPTVEFVGTVNSYTASNVVAKIKVDEGTATVAQNYYCINNSCHSITQNSVDVTFDEDGVYDFYVKSSINNNEVSSSVTKIMIDKTAPVIGNISYVESEENTTKTAQGYVLSIDGIVDASGVKSVSISIKDTNGTVVFQSNINLTSLNVVINTISTAGVYTVTITSIDNLNQSSSKEFLMNIRDRKINAATMVVDGEVPDGWVNRHVKITFIPGTNNPEGVKNYYCVGYFNCMLFTETFEMTFTDGEHTVVGTYSSYAGVNVYSDVEYYFNVDTVAPKVEKIYGYANKWATFLMTPYIDVMLDSCSDVGSGVKNVYYKNPEFVPEWKIFERIYFRDAITGVYHFEAYCEDYAGNKSEIYEFDVMLDHASPVIEENFYELSTRVVDGVTQRFITFKNIYDSHSGLRQFEFSLKNKNGDVVTRFVKNEGLTIPITLNIASVADGEYFFTIGVIDNVGNGIGSKQISLVIGGENSSFGYNFNVNNFTKNYTKTSNFRSAFLMLISIALISAITSLIVKKRLLSR